MGSTRIGGRCLRICQNAVHSMELRILLLLSWSRRELCSETDNFNVLVQGSPQLRGTLVAEPQVTAVAPPADGSNRSFNMCSTFPWEGQVREDDRSRVLIRLDCW